MSEKNIGKRSGFVTLIGRTNAGKSSLLNFLLGEKISIVSHKVNATRRKINGIVMNGSDQIIFVDTPGLHESGKLFNKLMVDVALKSIGDADLILFLASVHDDIKNYQNFLKLNPKIGHILVLTKIDEASQEKLAKKITEYSKFHDKFLALVPTSIKKNICKKPLLDEISKNLPEHEYFYNPELISTTNVRDIYRDFILEAIFDSVSSEVPYSTDVLIDKIVEKEELVSIYAKIITDTNSHKGILIGKNGDAIKRIGIKAKKLISEFEDSKIFLKLEISIKKNWKSDKNIIKKSFVY
ncbi:GTP-binding protein [Campylobacter blaseri]|uniref:GTPase Era n=1 Tax=Campylobacter blaseri TaxID=2042961 RepID=A0A2P8R2H1_9BACT|nr:GTPase Era [Campylobacter blaseri]PSM52697.1 GTPase Era [Campylobacter blaseri]PSM54345.1 GTPase Era [Campylobacter blaseri]QKF85998.1 GTP-binding protein [Campylobacter blaseri]